MSLAHLHLLLNHLPVTGAFLGILLLAAALARRSNELGKFALACFALLIASLGVGGLMGHTANLGGQIRHTEVRPGVTASVEGAQPASDEARSGEARERGRRR